MKKEPTNKKKDVFVAIILTESTSSLLKLNVPPLETIHPQNSKVCVITAEDIVKNVTAEQTNESCSSNVEQSKGFENIYLKIASEDVAVFSTSNCSSSSRMYDLSEDGVEINESSAPNSSSTLPKSSRNELRESISEGNKLFEIMKTHNYPLVSMRSKAHSNKLNIWGKDIFVTMLDSDSSRSSAEFICRICHGGESLEDLLTPCRCRGTVALVHLKCLERWLRESNHSSCELCQHHYIIVREAKYSVPGSIIVFLRHPGPHLKDILLDLVAFAVYTPSAVASTYMLLMICESLVKSNIVTVGSFSSHIIAFSAVFGMAVIDFTYSSWLITSIQKHIDAWSEWYRSNSTIKVVLPRIKMRPQRTKQRTPPP